MKTTKTGLIKTELKKIELREGPLPIKAADAHLYHEKMLYTSQLVGDIFVLNIFCRKHIEKGIQSPIWRIFIDKYKNKWITLMPDGDSWSSATIENLTIKVDSRNTYQKYIEPWQNCDKQLVESHFNGAIDSGLEAITKYQRMIMTNKLRGKHEKEKARIDNELEKIGNPPIDFADWIDAEVMKSYRYIFYEYTGKKQQRGLCTHCQKEVMVEGAKHDRLGICPNCQSEIIFKAKNKSASISITKWASVLCDVNDHSGRVAQRIYRIDRRISKRAEKITTEIQEMHRVFFSKDFTKYRGYYYGPFKQRGEIRWCAGGEGAFFQSVIYPGNIDAFLQEMKRTGLKEIIESQSAISLRNYAGIALRNPEVEYLAKAGLFKLALSLDHYFVNDRVNKNNKTLTGYLKLDGDGVNRCRKYDVDLYELSFLQELKKRGATIKDEEFESIRARDLCSHALAYLLKYMSLAKLDKYIKEQKNLHRVQFIIQQYSDYIRMCEKLEYDLKNDFVKFPKQLLVAHDEVQKRLALENARIQNEQMKKLHAPTQERWGLVFDGYIIKAPDDANEMIREGQVLKHCVGGYVDRVIDGETTVLFIREEKQPKKPFATMEVKNGKITQVHGKAHKDMREPLKKLLSKFKKEKKVG